jgi:cob(I)alamin adenosyltransferase
MMSISTKTGDGGDTDLLGGVRSPKDALRIECLGDLDELNAFLGDARCATAEERVREILLEIQKELFTAGAVVASAPAAAIASATAVADAGAGAGESAAGAKLAAGSARPLPDEARITAWVEEFEASRPMRGFSIPGANPASAKLDIARAVCRRAERRLVSLDHLEGIPGPLLKYMNRLSDLLFMLARSEE